MEVQRRSRAGQLLVDGSIEARGLSSGTFSSLNTDSSYLFLGGVPAMLTPLSVLSLEQQVHALLSKLARLAHIDEERRARNSHIDREMLAFHSTVSI